jgi:hypothetical protein
VKLCECSWWIPIDPLVFFLFLCCAVMSVLCLYDLVWHGINHDSPPPQDTHGNGILQLQGLLGKERKTGGLHALVLM